jgi:hypothetical protein
MPLNKSKIVKSTLTECKPTKSTSNESNVVKSNVVKGNAGYHTSNTVMGEAEVIKRLKSSDEVYENYAKLGRNPKWQQRLIDYFRGTKTLPITYDSFFKKIFDVDVYPHRLERFIGSVLCQNVKIKKVLPSEDSLLAGSALLIMDIKLKWKMVLLRMLKFKKFHITFRHREYPAIQLI